MSLPVAAPDPDNAQRSAADPAASVWVAASAGTGKTKVLTDRVLSLLLAGWAPHKILCLTFTKAAAAEMANRLADTLGGWAMAADESLDQELKKLLGRPPDAATKGLARTLFARVLDCPGGMNILTIHAFCQSLLGRFPLEAGVAPHFTVMDDLDAREMLLDARQDVLRRARAEAGGGALLAALRLMASLVHEQTFGDLLDDLARQRGRLTRLLDDHGGQPERAAATLATALGLTPGTTPGEVIAEAAADGAFDHGALGNAALVLQGGAKTDQAKGEKMAPWLAADAGRRADSLWDYARAFLTQGLSEPFAKLMTNKLADSHADAMAAIATEAARLIDAARRHRAAVCLRATTALLVLGAALIEAYRARKQARALLDYDDLIDAASGLLARPGIAPWVLYKLDGGIDHILIDEAQDTNPEQWKVVEALALEFFTGESARQDTRTLFAVGDAKQSIYSFQRADPAAFVAMRDLFADRVKGAERSWREVALTVSFRSVPAVLDAVDAVFARPQAAAGVDLDGHAITHQAWRIGQAGLVELWPPVEALEADPVAPWKPPVERIRGDDPQARLAGLVAGRIGAMINGEMLESRGRAIRPGDILVLVRRRTPFVDYLVRALKERAIAVAGADRMRLEEQIAVMDLAALGQFVLLPEDDLTLACVLKGPVVGLTEDQLFDLAHGRQGTLWRELARRQDGHAAFAAAFALLNGLLGRADFAPPFEFFAHILGPLGGRRRLVQRLGPDAEDAINEFVNLALAFEQTHAASLQGFLHWFQAGGLEIKRDLEQGDRDVVRIMTVHGAKGLQAPVVFLPDTLGVPSISPRLLWPESAKDGARVLLWPPAAAWREPLGIGEIEARGRAGLAEYRRLLYVAMTRAEDRLYVCGWQGKNKPDAGNWHELIGAALADKTDPEEDAFLAAAGETRSASVLRLRSSQDRPAPPAEQAQGALIPVPLPGWAEIPLPADTEPSSPLAPSRGQQDEPAARSPLGADGGLRFRRGRLVHKLLETLPDIEPLRRTEVARLFLNSPAHGLTAGEAEALLAETLAVMDAPAHAALFAPGSLAEVPVVGVIGGYAVSGQVDRLAVTEAGVDIVDYKTNRPPPATPEGVAPVYVGQMSAYRALLRRIYPGRAVRCWLLWTDGPRLMEVPESLLDTHQPFRESRHQGGHGLDAPPPRP